MGGDITVKLSYAERILNALSRVEHKRGDDQLARDKKDFDAINAVLAPVWCELAALRAVAEAARALDLRCEMHEAWQTEPCYLRWNEALTSLRVALAALDASKEGR